MSYVFYKVIHYVGIFMVVTVLGAALARGAEPRESDPWRRRFAAFHGIGLLLILTGGFGMLARLGFEHGTLFPGWVWAKLGIWVVLGGFIVAARKSHTWSARLLFLMPALAVVAGWLAFTKPF